MDRKMQKIAIEKKKKRRQPQQKKVVCVIGAWGKKTLLQKREREAIADYWTFLQMGLPHLANRQRKKKPHLPMSVGDATRERKKQQVVGCDSLGQSQKKCRKGLMPTVGQNHLRSHKFSHSFPLLTSRARLHDIYFFVGVAIFFGPVCTHTAHARSPSS
nr:hypothetical protein [Pandoravirus aubagnensis]